tara:strand:+ start:506 stop:1225 length:720 start_codon:yes stop_codon:yes gene_type:complete
MKKGNWKFIDVSNHWDNVDYDSDNSNIDSYYRRFLDTKKMVDIPLESNVLDVDCRSGNGTVFFKKLYPHSNFFSGAMADSFAKSSALRFKENDIKSHIFRYRNYTLPFDDNFFDFIFSYETLEHIPYPEIFLKEITRVMKPNASLILTTPNEFWEPVHWFSATFGIDHGEGPHRMVPRCEIVDMFKENHLKIVIEKSTVIIPLGPRLLLKFGKWLERKLPESVLRIICLRRSFLCKKVQ